MNFTRSSGGLLIPETPPAPPENTGAGSAVYDKAHSCCPKCGCTSHEQTTMGFLGGADRNRSKCSFCDWGGIVDDLVGAYDWHEFTFAPNPCSIFWVRRAGGSVELADWCDFQQKFQDIMTVGDREGLNTEYFDDVTHWACVEEKAFP